MQQPCSYISESRSRFTIEKLFFSKTNIPQKTTTKIKTKTTNKHKKTTNKQLAINGAQNVVCSGVYTCRSDISI